MLKWRSFFDGTGAPEPPFSPEARLTVIGLMAFACVSLATIQVLDPAPRLVWNATGSAPVGLYGVRHIDRLETGDLVLAWLPHDARVLAARRAYLPLNTPGVKRVAAVAGDAVCVRNGFVLINERLVARALDKDSDGRELSPWWGCRVLEADEILLLNDGSAGSFDGRYFGPSAREDVIGKLVPLWTF